MNFKKMRMLGSNEINFLSEVAYHKYIHSFFEVCETIANNNKRYYIVNSLTGDVIVDSESPVIISNWFNLLKC